MDDKGLGMTPGSRDVLLGHHALEWLPLLQNTNRGVVDLIETIHGKGITLPPLTVQQLDEASATYGKQVGLGVDCINPAAYAWLPVPLKERLLDVLHSFERKPERPPE